MSVPTTASHGFATISLSASATISRCRQSLSARHGPKKDFKKNKQLGRVFQTRFTSHGAYRNSPMPPQSFGIQSLPNRDLPKNRRIFGVKDTSVRFFLFIDLNAQPPTCNTLLQYLGCNARNTENSRYAGESCTRTPFRLNRLPALVFRPTLSSQMALNLDPCKLA